MKGGRQSGPMFAWQLNLPGECKCQRRPHHPDGEDEGQRHPNPVCTQNTCEHFDLQSENEIKKSLCTLLGLPSREKVEFELLFQSRYLISRAMLHLNLDALCM